VSPADAFTGPERIFPVGAYINSQHMEVFMKRSLTLLFAGAIAIAPTTTFGAPAHTPPSSGDISPTATTGQPNVECEDEGGTAPSQSGRDPGPGSPFLNEDSVSGAHYAGHQAGINDKNTASNSQYDIACFRGPERPQ
jgi:hypothetical protein